MSKAVIFIAFNLVGYFYRVNAHEVSFNLVVQRQLVNLDGYTRDAVTVNGEFIGPTIEANVGDQLLVTVTNQLLMQEVLSIHFHGIKQVGTPWADGTAFITNCPITFGSSLTYNFTANEPGTFLYHAHVGSLNMEGTSGMLVVYDKEADAYPLQTRSTFGDFAYDAELRIMLTDWYHPSVYTLNAMIEHNPFRWVGNGDSILINGLGESKLCSYNGSTTTITTTFSDGSQATVTSTCKGNRAVFALQREKTYLVRIVNAANMAFFNLALAGHYFTVLGTDGGSFTEPVDVQSVDLSSGQRYMALLRFNQSAAAAVSPAVNATYLMQVQTDWRGNDVSNVGIAHAYVTYGSDTEVKLSQISPLVPPNESRGWTEWYNIVTALNTSARNTGGAPLSETATYVCPPDSAVTKTFQLNGLQQFVSAATGKGLTPPSKTPGTPGTRLAWTTFNDSRFMTPPAPYLLTAYLSSHTNYTTSAASNQPSMGVHSESGGKQRGEEYSAQQALAPKDWDAYPIITPTTGSKVNLATPKMSRGHRSSPLNSARITTESIVSTSATAGDMLQPLRVEKNDVVDVVVQAYASGSGGCDLHPWHLHGHSFWLIARGSGVYDPLASDSAQDAYVSASPLRVDTVSGYPSNYSESRGDVLSGTTVKGVWRDPCGWFKIRFVADNPGYWLFHCHVGWHMEMGMSVVFDEASELVSAPPADYGMCGADGTYSTFAQLAAATSTTVVETRIEYVSTGGGDANIEHASVFQVLVSLLAVLFAALLLVALCVWARRHKWNGMFHRVDLLHPEGGAGNSSVDNPLAGASCEGSPAGSPTSAVGRGDVESGGGGGGGGAGLQMTALSVEGKPRGTATMVAPATQRSAPYMHAPSRDSTGDDEHEGGAEGHSYEDDLAEISFNNNGDKHGDKKQHKGRHGKGEGGGGKMAAGLRGIRRTLSRIITHEK